MVAVGIESMKNTVAAGRQGAKEAGKQIAKEGGKEVAKKTLTERFVDVGKQAVLTVIREEGSLAVARGISDSIGKFRGSVKKNAVTEVGSVLERPHIASALSEILAVDRFLGDSSYQRQLMQKIEAALKPHEHKLFNIIYKRIVTHKLF